LNFPEKAEIGRLAGSGRSLWWGTSDLVRKAVYVAFPCTIVSTPAFYRKAKKNIFVAIF